jgi:hypothetical protein
MFSSALVSDKVSCRILNLIVIIIIQHENEEDQPYEQSRETDE